MKKALVFNFPLFPAEIKVWFTDTPMDIVYANGKRVFDDWTHNKFGRGSAHCYEAEDGLTRCIILIHALNPERVMASTIAHECEHAKDALLEAWGFEHVDRELSAYILDYLVGRVTRFVYGIPELKESEKPPRWKDEE